MNLEVLSRISLLNDDEFEHVLNAIVQLFAEDRRLLETRGSLIVRKLCVLLSAKPIYISLAAVLEATDDHEFAAIMVRARPRACSLVRPLTFQCSASTRSAACTAGSPSACCSGPSGSSRSWRKTY